MNPETNLTIDAQKDDWAYRSPPLVTPESQHTHWLTVVCMVLLALALIAAIVIAQFADTPATISRNGEEDSAPWTTLAAGGALILACGLVALPWRKKKLAKKPALRKPIAGERFNRERAVAPGHRGATLEKGAPPPPTVPGAATLKLEIRAANCRATTLRPWIYTAKDEDRVMRFLIAGRYPAVLIADGASNYRTANGEVRGGGGDAALTAVRAMKTFLDQWFRHYQGAIELASILRALERMVAETDKELQAYNATAERPGATTLLFAFLWGPHESLTTWIYGYVGDGDITILHPSRMVRDWPLESWLMTGHKFGDVTVTLPFSATRGDFRPFVGATPYAPGDILLAASDGIAEIQAHLARRKVTFSQYLWKNGWFGRAHEGARGANSLFDHFKEEGISPSDDVTIAVIHTEVLA